MKLLHMIFFDKRLNNANPWILSTSRCNHDMEFITTYGKYNKSWIYYITKTSIYTSHIFSFWQIVVGENMVFCTYLLPRPSWMKLDIK